MGLLLRLALSDSSSSSMAVLQSALALSSLHRYGLQPDASRLRARALRTLATSTKNSIESPRIIQHIAASMILCHFQMLDKPNTLGQWYCHLSEVKNLIDHTELDRDIIHGEFSRLLNWVEYHIVVGQFSLQHWHTSVEAIVYNQTIKEVNDYVPTKQVVCQRRKIKGISNSSHEILHLLYLVFKIILRPTNSLYHTREYENSLRDLESRINNFNPSAQKDVADTTSDMNRTWVASLEFYKLAALIYLKRASRNFSGPSAQIDTMVKRAFTILHDLETFNLAFPLLIIGCEARKDDQRMRILELIDKTLETSCLRSLQGLRGILERIWVQDDLAVDHELDYMLKLDAVISSYRILPTFA